MADFTSFLDGLNGRVFKHSNNEILPTGDLVLTNNRSWEHILLATEFVDDGGKAATVNTTDTGITAHKANTSTNIQAPTNSPILIFGCRLGVTGVGGGITGTWAIRGTSSADIAGSGSDDVSNAQAFSSSAQRYGGPMVLPAGRFLTLVKTAFATNDPLGIGTLSELILIGTEPF